MKKIINKEKKTFNVLIWNVNSRGLETLDIIPYLIKCWNKDLVRNTEEIDNIEKLKNWLFGVCRYQYWARCEYEVLVAQWPFGSRKIIEDLKKVNFENPNSTEIFNIIMQDMNKIDVFTQIQMNIDILANLFWEIIHEVTYERDKKQKDK